MAMTLSETQPALHYGLQQIGWACLSAPVGGVLEPEKVGPAKVHIRLHEGPGDTALLSQARAQLHQLGPAEVEQRPARPSGDAHRAARSGPAQQVEQHGLGSVVGGVAGAGVPLPITATFNDVINFPFNGSGATGIW